MSTTVDLVNALKSELKTARMTYADLARSLDMAEELRADASTNDSERTVDLLLQSMIEWQLGNHAEARRAFERVKSATTPETLTDGKTNGLRLTNANNASTAIVTKPLTNT